MTGSAALGAAQARRLPDEPSLDQLLAEPIVQLLMRRDGNDESTIRHLLQPTAAARPVVRDEDDLNGDDPHSMPIHSDPTHRLRAGPRKQQIVETVLDLVAARGIESVSAQLVADTIGLSQPAVFRHFSTKELIWSAVVDWLEQRLVAIHPVADDEVDKPGLVVLSRLFLEHVKLIERYPALPKLFFSDHLRHQYPCLQARFAGIHNAYMARLSAVIDRAKSDGVVPHTLSSKDAATTWLSLLQGLGFRAAIARLPINLVPEAERVLSLYLRAVTASADAAAIARGTIGIAKGQPSAADPGLMSRQSKQSPTDQLRFWGQPSAI